MKKIRLDKLLISKGLAKSRAKAQFYIKSGVVKVDGKIEVKKSADYPESSVIEITENPCPYVSVGGLKLEKALLEFKILLRDKIVLDLGASTGGFTDCALKNGVSQVYSLDVGTNQLHESLRQNPKVKSIEKFNLRDINESTFKDKFDFVITDVSFISLKYVFEILEFVLKKDGALIALIKPQFEVGPENITKGVVKSRNLHVFAINRVIEYANNNEFFLNELTWSPISGSTGNKEYLGLFRRSKCNKISQNMIKSIVDEAWNTL